MSEEEIPDGCVDIFNKLKKDLITGTDQIEIDQGVTNLQKCIKANTSE